MSTYRTTNNRFSVCLREVQADLRHFEALSQGITSHSVAACLTDPVRLTATLPNLAHTLPSLAAAVNAPGLDLASQRQLVASVAADLAVAEREAVVAVAELSLTELGYSHRTLNAAGVSALEAWRGNELVLITVPDGATGIEVDHAGLSGTSCLDTQAALEAQMATHGVHWQATTAIDHVSDRGGNLISAAARVNPGHLAEGAILHHQTRGTTSAVSSLFPTSGRRGRATKGSA